MAEKDIENKQEDKKARKKIHSLETKLKDLEEKAAQQQKAAEEQQALAAESKDQYVRLAAEFDNYRRRTAKERLELIGTAGKDVLLGILPVVDDCERALQVLKDSDASPAAIEGTELIYNKLINFLKSKGMTKIESKGKDFDTDFHEAVAQFPVQDESMKNKVIDVTQEGYMLNGSVVRFAKVVVGI